jgi:Mtf2 family
VVKDINGPGHVFRIPEVNQSLMNSPGDFLDDVPPSSNTPPFLKIVMSRSETPKFSSGHFRPESTAVKSLTGSTISSGEREIFAKIFDEMLTRPIASDPLRRHRSIKGRRSERPNESTPKSTSGLSISAAILDESLFLTPKEVEEYPPALRPLAAKIAREETIRNADAEWKHWEKRIDSCSTDYDLAKFLDTEVFSIMDAHAQGLPPDAGKSPLHSLRSNYSSILLKAMRLFRLVFHNPLAAHTLFLRAKTLSAESYVLGCTTLLYNELLLSRWESFTDLLSISEILDEMSTNGVKGDKHTVSILQRIQENVQEWETHGVETIRPVWVSEKERMAKLDRYVRDILAGMESDLQKEEIVEMEKEIHKMPVT